MPRTRQAMKQRRPAATDDGMNDDAVLVDEPQLLERSRELGRSDEDTRSVFAFSAEIASRRSPSTLIVFCHGKSLREPDTTYFAFASIFCAHSRIARGAFSSRATAGQAPSISS